MRIALALAAILFGLQDEAKIVVQDGKTSAVFYGWSPIFDLWGNMRRESRTLRPDGLMLYGAPRESLEEFCKRPLTADERKDCGTYEIRGAEFPFTYRDASKSTGSVQYEADGSIKAIKASGLDLYPVRPGIPFELTGYWSTSTSFNNGAYKMSTTQFKNYSFFKGGLFVHESGTSTICTAVETKTRERTSGNDVIRETVQQEALRFYGDQAKARMGKFRIEGSALRLDYDNGQKDSIFIGTAFSGKPYSDGTYGLMIGGALYDGRPGVYPKPAGTPAAAPPPAPVVCKTPQFELQVPPGWTLRDQGELHFLIPDDREADDPFVVVLLGTALAAKAEDPALAKEFEGVVKSLAKGAKVTSGGETQKLSLDGADAVRIPYLVETDGKPFRVEATCAVRGGQALVALAMGSETAMKKSGEKARALILTAKIAGEAPKTKIASAHFEMEMPKDWKTREAEDGGIKITFLVPPGRDLGNEYAAFLMSTPAQTLTSATEKAAMADLQATVKQIAGGLEPGEPETFKAGGEPAITVRCAGKNGAGDVIVVQGFMVVNHGKAVVLMLAGKEKLASEHAAAIRAGFESLKVKK